MAWQILASSGDAEGVCGKGMIMGARRQRTWVERGVCQTVKHLVCTSVQAFVSHDAEVCAGTEGKGMRMRVGPFVVMLSPFIHQYVDDVMRQAGRHL